MHYCIICAQYSVYMDISGITESWCYLLTSGCCINMHANNFFFFFFFLVIQLYRLVAREIDPSPSENIRSRKSFLISSFWRRIICPCLKIAGTCLYAFIRSSYFILLHPFCVCTSCCVFCITHLPRSRAILPMYKSTKGRMYNRKFPVRYTVHAPTHAPSLYKFLRIAQSATRFRLGKDLICVSSYVYRYILHTSHSSY